MKPKDLALGAGVLALLACSPAWAQGALNNWYIVKDPQELRDLYSNKTFRGNGWVGYYRADGHGMVVIGNLKPSPRTWEVEADGRVCVTAPDRPRACSQIQRNRAKPDELMGTNLTTGRSLTFKLEEGVPDF
jgi:hypothetical protein